MLNKHQSYISFYAFNANRRFVFHEVPDSTPETKSEKSGNREGIKTQSKTERDQVAATIEFSPEQKECLKSINKKFKAAKDQLRDAVPSDPAIVHRISLENVLMKLPLTAQEREMVDFILKLDPKILGITIPKTTGSVEFLSSRDVVFAQADEKHEIPLLPAQRDAFERMAAACKEKTGETLYPVEGYRSKGYQLTKFIEHLVEKDDFDIKTTAHTVALPGYSEHESTTTPAMDIGVAGHTEDFVKTKSYEWMRKNASQYGFIESYTLENTKGKGVKPEPWHWKFIGKQ